MADFKATLSAPNTQFTQVAAPSPDRVTAQAQASSRQATSQALSDVVKIGAGIWGKSEARSRGRELSGAEESYEEAASEVAEAGLEISSLLEDEQDDVEGPVSPERARDLKEEVFGEVLTNHRRIESALKRGLISSTEANARVEVLRGEALSNPLVAAYQEDLDNALFRHTGGAGTFGATAEEEAAAAARKGQLAAMQETQEQASRLVQMGVAASDKQARAILAEREELAIQQEQLQAKKARLGLTSQEMYAYGQNIMTDFSSTGFSQIAAWVKDGAHADDKRELAMGLEAQGEMAKREIRDAAFDKNGNLVMKQDTLQTLLSEVDEEVGTYKDMLEDHSATEHILAKFNERQQRMDYHNQGAELHLMKAFPMLFAGREVQGWTEWVLNSASGVNELATMWDEHSNPYIRELSRMSEEGIQQVMLRDAEAFLNGALVDEAESGGGGAGAGGGNGNGNGSGGGGDNAGNQGGGGASDPNRSGVMSSTGGPFWSAGKAALGHFLTKGGGMNIMREAWNRDPEVTRENLRSIPFTFDQINNSREFNKVDGDEDVGVLQSAVEGAATRVLLNSMNGAFRRESMQEMRDRGGWWPEKIKFHQLPSKVEVKVEETNRPAVPAYPGTSSPRALGRRRPTYSIDTGDAHTTPQFRREVVNAYELARRTPALWEDEFESPEQYINDLFARPEEAE